MISASLPKPDSASGSRPHEIEEEKLLGESEVLLKKAVAVHGAAFVRKNVFVGAEADHAELVAGERDDSRGFCGVAQLDLDAVCGDHLVERIDDAGIA